MLKRFLIGIFCLCLFGNGLVTQKSKSFDVTLPDFSH